MSNIMDFDRIEKRAKRNTLIRNIVVYGLLGLCIGAALYAAGVAPAVAWLHRRLTN